MDGDRRGTDCSSLATVRSPRRPAFAAQRRHRSISGEDHTSRNDHLVPSLRHLSFSAASSRTVRTNRTILQCFRHEKLEHGNTRLHSVALCQLCSPYIIHAHIYSSIFRRPRGARAKHVRDLQAIHDFDNRIVLLRQPLPCVDTICDPFGPNNVYDPPRLRCE